MQTQKNIITIMITLIVAVGAVLLFTRLNSDEDTWLCENGIWIQHGNPSTPQATTPCDNTTTITTFRECVDAGNPVMESYPRQCRSGETTFTEDIGNELEVFDSIRIDFPHPHTVVTSPLSVSGMAVGPWFFEGSFSIVLYDADGTPLAESAAAADGAWTTENFVPFSALLSFDTPASTHGILRLYKANPSGLPAHDAQLYLPVEFPSPTPVQ